MLNKLPAKRVRIFAGPNGSGKSALYPKLKSEYSLRFGIYVNADEISETLQMKGFVDFDKFGIKANKNDFQKFYLGSGWSRTVRKKDYLKKWSLKKNIISVNKSKIEFYDPAIISDYIRLKLLKKGDTFTFETVMSHKSKIDFIRNASKKGYKVYLYFIATEDSEINLNRVKIRVIKGGHSVPEEKIKKRYENTLNLLLDAMTLSYRSYIFDNTNQIELIAEGTPDKKLQIISSSYPQWFKKFVLDKISK